MHLSYILVFIIVYNTPYGESTVRRALHGDSNMTLSDAEDEGKPNKPRSKETEKENLNITSEADGIKKLLDHGDAEIVDMETTDENENDENSSETDEEQSYKKYYNEKIGQVSEVMGNMWPLGIIPYKVDMSSYDSVLASRVRDAMDFLEGVSCVQFKHLSNNTEGHFVWIHITNPEGQRECSHEPKKKRSGEIVLILGLECLKKREILHSLLHGIGFGDEVTHHLRDQYVRIMWENIQPKYQHLFVYSLSWPRLEKEVIEEYDPMSIMHFHDRAFSKNGQATIVPLMPGLQIQPSEKLSQLDKMKLRLAFGHECNRRTVDKLFDTCKSVMRDEKDDGDDDEETDDNESDNDGENKTHKKLLMPGSNQPKNDEEKLMFLFPTSKGPKNDDHGTLNSDDNSKESLVKGAHKISGKIGKKWNYQGKYRKTTLNRMLPTLWMTTRKRSKNADNSQESLVKDANKMSGEIGKKWNYPGKYRKTTLNRMLPTLWMTTRKRSKKMNGNSKEDVEHADRRRGKISNNLIFKPIGSVKPWLADKAKKKKWST